MSLLCLEQWQTPNTKDASDHFTVVPPALLPAQGAPRSFGALPMIDHLGSFPQKQGHVTLNRHTLSTQDSKSHVTAHCILNFCCSEVSVPETPA